MTDLKTLIREGAIDLIKSVSLDLFRQYPKMESFAWRQHSHYRDEGSNYSADLEPQDIIINGKAMYEWARQEDDYCADETYFNIDDIPETDRWVWHAARDVTSLIGELAGDKGFDDYDTSLTDTMLFALFGYDVEVTITPQGITTSEWDYR